MDSSRSGTVEMHCFSKGQQRNEIPDDRQFQRWLKIFTQKSQWHLGLLDTEAAFQQEI